MPGIFGLVSQSPGSGAAQLLGRMADRMKHHPWYVEDRYVDEKAGAALGRMALGFINPERQPSFTEDRSLAAVLDGEVYDYEEQRRALEAAGHVFSGTSCAELLAHGFEAQGVKFFAGLHGKFVAALWDAGTRRLVLATDRFGMRNLYYARLPGRLLFASEIKALLADPELPRRHHLPGIAQFFTYGQLLGEDTFLECVRLLPAAGCLTYDPRDGRLAVERYWRLEDRAGGPEVTEAQALDRIAEAFDRAVRRCAAGGNPLGLSLSGGLDSRTVLAAVDPGRPLTTICVGMDGSMDHRSAEEMARLAGRPHHRVVLDDGFLAQFGEHLRHMVRLTDGHYLSQCIVMPTLPFYRDLGVEVLLRGHAGELMHMTKAYNFSLDGEALAARDEAALEGWLFRHLQTYMLEGTEGRLFAPPHRGRMEDLARESLRCCLQASRGVAPPVNRVWHLFISQRLRRETAMSLVKFGSLVETRLPYLDNELVDALLAAPPRLKLGETIQAHLLRRRFPAFLNVVNVNTGARMGAGSLERLFGKARQKVLAKLGARGYQPYERLGLWLRRELRPLVGQVLLDPCCLERGIFDPQAVRDVVDRHTNGQSNHTFLIMAMMAFELGQREFVDGEGMGSPPEQAAQALCPR
jgi:asparagine synthase (glutamine-hydrolysing)